jgi:response regulator of citrate/malate metabolism
VAIVEDDFRIAAIHEKFLLKVTDIAVVGKALNGAEAITLLKNYRIDLLHKSKEINQEIIDVFLGKKKVLPHVKSSFQKELID